MPLFPITFPFVFGLVEADTTRVDVAVNLNATIGAGAPANDVAAIAASTADGQTSVVIDASLAVTATPTGSGGFGLRATPTVDVELTADVILDGHAAADLTATGTPTGVAAPGVDGTTTATATPTGGANLDTSAAASATAAATATADGLRSTSDDSSLTATSAASAGASRGQSVAATSVTVTATPSADMARTVYADANLDSTANVSGDEQKTRPADANQTATATPIAGGRLAAQAGSSLQCVTIITADGRAYNGYEVTLAVTAAFTARAQIGPTPAERVGTIPVDQRTGLIAVAPRRRVIDSESRNLTVTAPTTVAVPADNRTLVVEQRT